ncbi:uncharacterized protein LOC106158433 isoform X3 [Lingula anatina]|uniref:Uncharacterized protein LOC106158433 isoform X1 n=1 Tax=Lingula anatina TaxID=7574 RepID=A0A1S3HWB5_LINAN|nr:uncharacterized protein LOC106158433 isoform X1 [Lingula anatina]XP_013389841.1 uncharacterized protein LOC106158433 isoform X2 [Lingula anatina]XP_013389842.1 uncharacterized protein LOC106158433 isoform X3 [Lingula anatina]|eukprot:XP_013389840.1 uncharacterized protein LOC106158433 isoform X1 [Lingula anatina]
MSSRRKKVVSISESANLIPITEVLGKFYEAEEHKWRSLDIANAENGQDSKENNPNIEVGNVLLRHCRALKNIQRYFINLEARKCCLHLTPAQPTTFSNIRLVRSDTADVSVSESPPPVESIAGRVKIITSNSKLNEKDFTVYKHAILCAHFPQLCAPDPPSSPTPTPNPSTSSDTTPAKLYSYENSTEGSIHYRSLRAISPTGFSFEQQDEAASLVQPDGMCELLRQAFGLAKDRAMQYNKKVYDSYGRKPPAKILVEELVGQLSVLENNKHPFYNPHNFLTRNAYDKWQQQQRLVITELINKFWHFSLPPLSSGQTVDLSRVHEEYEYLMRRLISFETCMKQQNAGTPQYARCVPYSATSARILTEFGLRYGVGELYRRIVYLQYLAENLESEPWFVEHTTCVLCNIRDMLPQNRGRVIMVKQEFEKLQTAIIQLHGQCGNFLTKMKRLFPENKPQSGVGTIIELLDNILKMKVYLSGKKQSSVGDWLQQYAEESFLVAYERHKTIASTDLKMNTVLEPLSAKLLNVIMLNIRDELIDYRTNYQATFEDYFNISQIAAVSFYEKLMEDVEDLCDTTLQQTAGDEVDLLMVSLAYRLSQLDQDWACFIRPKFQRWRHPFLLQVLHWLYVLKEHMQTLVLESVATEQFRMLKLTSELYQAASLAPLGSDNSRVHSPSMFSLTPSVHSAFSTPHHLSGSSSAHSTPGIEEDAQLNGQASRITVEALVHGDRKGSSLQQPQTHYEIYQSKVRQQNDLDTRSVDVWQTDAFLQGQGGFVTPPAMQGVLTFQKTIHHSKSLPTLFTSSDYGSDTSDYSPPFGMKDDSNWRWFGSPELETPKANKSKNGVTFEKDPHSSERTPVNAADTEGIKRSKDSNRNLTGKTDDSEQEKEFGFPPLTHIAHLKPIDNQTQMTAHEDVLSSESFEQRELADARPEMMPYFDPYTGSYVSRSSFTAKPLGEGLQFISLRGKSQSQKPRILASKVNSASTAQRPTSSRKSSRSHIKSPTTQKTQHGLSEITLADPAYHLPISGSVFDVVTMSQRYVTFAKTMCDTICPLPVFEEHTPPPTPLEESMGSSTASSNPLDPEFSLRAAAKEAMLGRKQVYNKLLQCVSNTVCLYADNMMSMDLCAVFEKEGIDLVGVELIKHLKKQRKQGLIWGCRHQLEGIKDCFFYMRKNPNILSGSHEPITESMCVRINNVTALLDLLPDLWARMSRAVEAERLFEERSRSGTGESSAHQSSFGDSEDRYFSFTRQLSSDSVLSHGSEVTDEFIPKIGLKVKEKTKHHLQIIWKGLVNILAYRMNLFFKDALTLLLSIQRPTLSIEKQLKPLIDFFTDHLTSLAQWLYRDSFRKFLEVLWLFLAKDFNAEVESLKYTSMNSEAIAEVMLQTIAFFIKYLNEDDRGLDLDFLTTEVENVIFKLQLYTTPTVRLMRLYLQLQAERMQDTYSQTPGSEVPNKLFIAHMQHDLHAIRKCFSGQELVDWIVTHPQALHPKKKQSQDSSDSNYSVSSSTEESESEDMVAKAGHLGQKMLEKGVICSVEEDMYKAAARGRTYSDFSNIHNPFGQVTLDSRPASTFNKRASDNSSRTNKPSTSMGANSQGKSTRNLDNGTGIAGSDDSDSDETVKDSSSSEDEGAEFPPSSQVPKETLVGVEVHHGARGGHTSDSGIQSEGDCSRPTSGVGAAKLHHLVLQDQIPEYLNSGDHADTRGASPALSQRDKLVENMGPQGSALGRHSAESFKSSLSSRPGSSSTSDLQIFHASKNHFYCFSNIFDSITMDDFCGSSEMAEEILLSLSEDYVVVSGAKDNKHKHIPNLLQKCKDKNVTLEFIVAVLYSRRKRDVFARDFLKLHVPVELVEGMDKPLVKPFFGCFVPG